MKTVKNGYALYSAQPWKNCGKQAEEWENLKNSRDIEKTDRDR
jgi:hypothetical protein